MQVNLHRGSNEWTLTVGDSRIILNKQSDALKLGTDFIVNPSKLTLKNGGGLNKAIHEAAGSAIDTACDHIKADKHGTRCNYGKAKITTAGKLSHAAIIHTVGPDLKKKKGHKPSKQDAKNLSNCYTSSCKLADLFCRYVENPQHKHNSFLTKVHSVHEAALRSKLAAGKETSITFPCISTGIFKYPTDKAAKAQINALVDYAKTHQGKKSTLKEFHISTKGAGQSVQKQMEIAYKALGGH